MNFRLLIAAFAVCVAPAANAQEKPIYFVVDASGSMRNDNQSDASALLRATVWSLPRGQPVSITYFGAKPENPEDDYCAKDVVASNPISRETALPPFPELGGSDDKTAIGRALESILRFAGNQPRVVLITDGGEECNADFASIRSQYADAEIKVLQVGRTQNSALKLLEIKPDSRGGSPNAATRTYNWDDEGWWERWLWLVIFLVGIGSAIFFTLADMFKAQAYEKRTGEIQQLQRLVLVGEGDVEAHKEKIANLGEFPDPKKPVLIWFGIVTAGFALVAGAILLFCEGAFLWLPLDDESTLLWVKLDAARQLAWSVLSSGFSNSFAILAITPILVASAQNLRRVQARSAFGLAADTAAQEATKRNAQEVGNRFRDLEDVRSRIPNTLISTPWARELNLEDREYLSSVKKRLLIFAQGPEPTQIAATKKALSDAIEKLKRYTPKRRLVEKNWKMPELIRDVDTTWKPFEGETADWLELAAAIDANRLVQISAGLKKLAGDTPA